MRLHYVFGLVLVYLLHKALPTWLSQEAAETIARKFFVDETARGKIQFRGTDLRTSSPFISGDGFRNHCKHICDETNRCRMHPESVQNASCICVRE